MEYLFYMAGCVFIAWAGIESDSPYTVAASVFFFIGTLLMAVA